MKGIFGDMFDFDHDGELNAFERATELHFIDEMSKDESDDSDDFMDDDFSNLETAGLDVDDLEFMDENERREALEDAGLDPDDYDFYYIYEK